MSVEDYKITSKDNALSTIRDVSEKLFFFSKVMHTDEIDNNDCLVMEGYLCEMGDRLAATYEFLAMKAPATRPESEEAGA